jgi:hypothetical protein
MYQRSLAAIMIVVMVPSAMAPCPYIFQIAALALSLAAMFTMLALGVMQLGFGFANLVLAPSVIITIKRPCGNHSAQE